MDNNVNKRCWLLALLLMSGVMATSGRAAQIKMVMPQEILAFLSSSDPTLQGQGTQEAEDWFKEYPGWAAENLVMFWGKQLLANKQYDKVAYWAWLGVTERADNTELVQDLMELRVKALLLKGEHQEALAAAKSFFNVCKTDKALRACQLLYKCLEQSDAANGKELAERFKREQIAGANTQGTEKLMSKVLAGITIDGGLYEKAADHFLNEQLDDYKSKMGVLNLNLLRDKVQEAASGVEGLPINDKKLMVATKARVLKAVDGTIGRANHYLVTGQYPKD